MFASSKTCKRNLYQDIFFNPWTSSLLLNFYFLSLNIFCSIFTWLFFEGLLGTDCEAFLDIMITNVQKVQILSWSSNKVSAKVSNLSSQSRFYDLKWVKCGRTDVKEWNCEKRLKRNLPSWRRWRECFRILEVKQNVFMTPAIWGSIIPLLRLFSSTEKYKWFK